MEGKGHKTVCKQRGRQKGMRCVLCTHGVHNHSQPQQLATSKAHMQRPASGCECGQSWTMQAGRQAVVLGFACWRCCCCCLTRQHTKQPQLAAHLDVDFEARWQAPEQLGADAQADECGHAAVLNCGCEHDPAVGRRHQSTCSPLMSSIWFVCQSGCKVLTYLTYPLLSSTVTKSSSTTFSCSRLYGCSGSVMSLMCSKISDASMGSRPSRSTGAASCSHVEKTVAAEAGWCQLSARCCTPLLEELLTKPATFCTLALRAWTTGLGLIN